MRKKIWPWLAIIILLLFSYSLFWQWRLVHKTEITAWTTDTLGDCAVVLTGGPGRVREGLDLLSQKQVRKLIISGVHPSADLHDIFPERPFYGNFNENDVVLERRSTTTYGNAQQTLALVEALQCRDIILITSQLHMSRAKRTFQSVFGMGYLIQERAVLSGASERQLIDVLWESLKSLFYSSWAY